MSSKVLVILRATGIVLLPLLFFGAGCEWLQPKSTTPTSTQTGSTSTGMQPSTSTIGQQPTTSTYNRFGGQATVPARVADIRAMLNRLMGQHVALSASVARNILDNRPDVGASTQALDANSKAIAQVLSGASGVNSDALLDGWRKHVDAFVAYTTATKQGDTKAQQAAIQRMTTQSQAIAQLFSKGDASVQSNIQNMLNDQARLMKGVVDAYASKKYQDSYAQQIQANDQAGKIADFLVIGTNRV